MSCFFINFKLIENFCICKDETGASPSLVDASFRNEAVFWYDFIQIGSLEYLLVTYFQLSFALAYVLDGLAHPDNWAEKNLISVGGMHSTNYEKPI